MVFGLVMGAVLLGMGHMSFGVVEIALAAGIGVSIVSHSLGRAGGRVAKAFTAGTESTPYEEQFSYQQALVMKGKVDEALASFEELIEASPNAVQPRLRAAELYAKHDAPRRAAELLREALRSPALTAGQNVYATNRLVDLLAGPLGDPGRACVELRRLIDRYPRSTNAQHAREALARIKERMSAGR
jgi:predicted Zn-dependent protease